MRSVAITVLAVVAVTAPASALTGSFAGSSIQTPSFVTSDGAMTMEYIPSGMSKEQWRKMKDNEKNKNKGKDLGKVGITSFKSRTFSEWQKAGGINLFPVDPKSVKNASEIPYMQRKGGLADGSDLKGGKKKPAGNMFGKKKAAAKTEPEPEKKKNWWSL